MIVLALTFRALAVLVAGGLIALGIELNRRDYWPAPPIRARGHSIRAWAERRASARRRRADAARYFEGPSLCQRKPAKPAQRLRRRLEDPGADGPITTRNRRRPTWKSATPRAPSSACVCLCGAHRPAWSAGGSRPLPRSRRSHPRAQTLRDFVVDRGAASHSAKRSSRFMQSGATASRLATVTATPAPIRSEEPVSQGRRSSTAPTASSAADFRRTLADPDNAVAALADTKNVVGSQSIVNTKFDHVVPGRPPKQAPIPDKVSRSAAATSASDAAQRSVGHQCDVQLPPAGTGRRRTFQRRQRLGTDAWREGAAAPLPDQLQPVRLGSRTPRSPRRRSAHDERRNHVVRGPHGPDIARKLTSLRPLGGQSVDPSDGVLGPYAAPSGKGLTSRTPT